MKGKELKNIVRTLELKDGKHKVAVDYNTFELLEEMYGDVDVALSVFNGVISKTDIKKYICACINSLIENEEDRYTLFSIGKILDISKSQEYVAIMLGLLNEALPAPKSDIDKEDKDIKN